MPVPDLPPAPIMLGDESVGTRQLENLAVTVAKIDDPLQIAAVTGKGELNQPLDTTLSTVLEVPISIPSWAGECFVVCSGRLQWSNTSGGNQNLYAIVRVKGQDTGVGTEITLANATTGANAVDYAVGISAPGSTVTMELAARTPSGTNNANNAFLSVLALVTR